jgi:glutathione S-transferase
MRLFDFTAAPSPRKVRIFAAEKGLDIPTVAVDLRARTQHGPEFLAVNPAATVPVLELDDGTVLTESLAICRYLEDLEPEPALFGSDACSRALVLMWNDIATLEGYLAIQEVLRNEHAAFADRGLPGPDPYAQIPELAVRGRARAARFFDRLEERLGGVPYLAGEALGYADIAGYVYTAFAERALGEDVCADRPALRRWHRALAARPAFASP